MTKLLLSGELPLTKKRTFHGRRLDFEKMFTEISLQPSGSPQSKTSDCNKWAVLTASSRKPGPPEVLTQLMIMEDWCVVVVKDEDGEWLSMHITSS